MNEQVRVGVSVLIEKDGMVLMGLRKGSHGAGTWAFPGGHVDFGEGPIMTARREVFEETGMDVGAVQVVRTMPWCNGYFPEVNRQYITLYLRAEYIGGEPKLIEPHKCEGWRWVSWDSPPTPLFGGMDDFWDLLTASCGKSFTLDSRVP